jgi:hypothetical protein
VLLVHDDHLGTSLIFDNDSLAGELLVDREEDLAGEVGDVWEALVGENMSKQRRDVALLYSRLRSCSDSDLISTLNRSSPLSVFLTVYVSWM